MSGVSAHTRRRECRNPDISGEPHIGTIGTRMTGGRRRHSHLLRTPAQNITLGLVVGWPAWGASPRGSDRRGAAPKRVGLERFSNDVRVPLSLGYVHMCAGLCCDVMISHRKGTGQDFVALNLQPLLPEKKMEAIATRAAVQRENWLDPSPGGRQQRELRLQHDRPINSRFGVSKRSRAQAIVCGQCQRVSYSRPITRSWVHCC